MKLLKILFLSLSTMLLSGCFTLLNWEDREPISSGNQKVEVDEDNLTAFGMVKSTQQLVMIGEKYWFVADAESSKQIKALIDAKLPETFNTYGLQVELDKEAKNWKTNAGISYTTADTQAEITKLKQLGFKSYCPECPKNTQYVHQYPLQGQLYKKADIQIAESGKLRKAIPVKLVTEKYQINGVGSTLATIALTPITLASDIVTLPFQIWLLSLDSGDIFKP
ncbi:hypothetical protein [Glaesserella sp.]|uniref:hypothetical protein n=1 Tax=Glaesserella sp. TaxID=2094731 RepID=UPI0035A047FE